MKVLCVRGKGDVDFDLVITRIAAVWPGTKVLDPDYYSTLLQRQLKVAAQLKLPNPNPVTECTTRVSKKHGIQREFEIPIGDLRIHGRIDRFGCLLVADRDFQRDDVAELVQVLAACGLTVTGDEENADVNLG